MAIDYTTSGRMQYVFETSRAVEHKECEGHIARVGINGDVESGFDDATLRRSKELAQRRDGNHLTEFR